MELKNNVLLEKFIGNQINLKNNISFINGNDRYWSFSEANKSASIVSAYYDYAIGSFKVKAPLQNHLILKFKEKLVSPRYPVSTSLSGNSKMIGENTYLIEKGTSFSRNYYMQRGRNGSYGRATVSDIKIIEIPGNIPVNSVFGKKGTANMDIEKRTQPFYLFSLLGEDRYEWESFTNLDYAKNKSDGDLTIEPKYQTKPEILMLRNFKLYEIIDGIKLLSLNEKFDNLSKLTQGVWEPLPSNGKLEIGEIETQENKEPDLVYKKGELVAYKINYSDYENDPSKREYWEYTHIPMNDGPHPLATTLNTDGEILSQPIERFYIDGKYTVSHWQEDNTARSKTPVGQDGFPIGNIDYDKLSNRETLTFYIEGTQEAPWIVSINTGKTNNQGEFYNREASSGNSFDLYIKVDDLEKDILNLTTEVYKDGTLIYTNYKENISLLGEDYPPIILKNVAIGEAGIWQVVCTVRDKTGAGLGTYKFLINEELEIKGTVKHTEAWNEKRKAFNIIRPILGDNESPREYIKFWPGEAFEVSGLVKGSPIRVTCEITDFKDLAGESKYKIDLDYQGYEDFGKSKIYEGVIWNNELAIQLIKSNTMPLNFKFTAIYENTIKYDYVQVLIDNQEKYNMIHRVW